MTLRALALAFSPPRGELAATGLRRSVLFRDVDDDAVDDLQCLVTRVAAGADITLEDEPSEATWLLLEGWAYRHKTLHDGRRQIVGFIFPGDSCSSWTSITGHADHGVRTLTEARLAKISRHELAKIAEEHPLIARRLAAAADADRAVLNAWLLNLGRRKAPERIAHLVCELGHRMATAGLQTGQAGRELPLTQRELADALGLTNVHVNRVLRRLRAAGLIASRKGALVILDDERLREMADFDPGYLPR